MTSTALNTIIIFINLFFAGKLNADRVKEVMDHIIRLQELIQRLQKLRIDNIEYAYLRALVLFSTGEWLANSAALTITLRVGVTVNKYEY